MFPLFIAFLCVTNGLAEFKIHEPTNSKFGIKSIKPSSCGIPSVPTMLSRNRFNWSSSEHNEWPWMAVITPRTSSQRFCSGVLISDQYILTTADCVYRMKHSGVKVRLGVHSIRHFNKNERNYSTASIYIHERFDRFTLDHNIALIKLKSRVQMNHSIKPICLSSDAFLFDRRVATVTGWGTTSKSAVYNDVLQKAEVFIWNLKDCNDVLVQLNLGKVDHSKICAAHEHWEKNLCLGDKGSPLMIRPSSSQPWQLVGIVSRGQGCGQSNAPGVYTRVGAYLGWIISKFKPTSGDGNYKNSSNLTSIWPQSCGKSANEQNSFFAKGKKRAGFSFLSSYAYFFLGGITTKEQKWPWMASLLHYDDSHPTKMLSHFCGGSIITDQHILTAAHCVRRRNPTEIIVRLGEYDFDVNSTFERDFAVENIISHPNYDRRNLRNDISILKLKEKITISDRIRPLCLPPKDIEVTGQLATGTGWGQASLGRMQSSVLQETAVEIWTREKCQTVYPISDGQMCAGFEVADACQGDSGGPLMLQANSDSWSIVGIASRGQRCGQSNKPGLYTRVADYLDWIRETVEHSIRKY